MAHMKVLVVTPWFPSVHAPGSGIFNLRDVELLAHDHEIRVLHLVDQSLLNGSAPADEEVLPGVWAKQIPFSMKNPKQLIAAVRQIREAAKRAEVVHSMAFPALLPVSLARLKLPWIHTEHWSGLVTTPPTLQSRLGAKVLRRGLAKPDSVVAVSQYLADAIAPHRTGPISVIGNKVMLAGIDSSDASHSSAEAGVNSAQLKIVGVGGLVTWKGPLEAVDALAELVNEGMDASLVWAGVGPLTDEVLSRADERGVRERVELLGHVSPLELSRVLSNSDVFVLPTNAETFGVAIAEAMGAGLPVVTSGIGGHIDMLAPRASRLVDARDGRALATAIAALMADPNRLSRNEIIAYAHERFSETVRREAYARVYEQLLTAHR